MTKTKRDLQEELKNLKVGETLMDFDAPNGGIGRCVVLRVPEGFIYTFMSEGRPYSSVFVEPTQIINVQMPTLARDFPEYLTEKDAIYKVSENYACWSANDKTISLDGDFTPELLEAFAAHMRHYYAK